MTKVIEFSTAQQRADEELAEKIIEAVGFDATLHLRRFAAALDAETSAMLLRVAEIIEERQGFGWYLAEAGQALAARRLVRDLRAVVRPTAGHMAIRQAQIAEGRTVGPKAIGDDGIWEVSAPFQQTAQGRCHVAGGEPRSGLDRPLMRR